jgi:glycosyltransferase involved in cell wall biosynthesis
MRIAFIVIGNSRRSNYLNGHTLRYGNGGGSGTDGSSILMAEYLAKQGHEVVFVADRLEPRLEEEYKARGITYVPGREFYGVKYTNIEFEGIENREFDILVSMLWFHDYKSLPITVTKSVIYWSHMQWVYGIEEIVNYVKDNNLSLGFVHISEWEKNMTKNIVDSVKNRPQFKNEDSTTKIKSTLIPNPVLDDMINEVTYSYPTRKPHKFVFHAAWARGGNVAVEAVRKLNFEDSEFHAFDYLLATHHHQDSFFNLHNGVDKKTLFTNIAESEYFIYPLYTPYQDVHKDTFSCVVAEAIALGAIVVTYPLGALPENFEGFCQWLDFPEGVDVEKMQNEALTKDLDGKFTITDNIVEKIKFLEENPEIKEDIRRRGKDYILSKFNVNKIGSMWVDFINDLV